MIAIVSFLWLHCTEIVALDHESARSARPRRRKICSLTCVAPGLFQKLCLILSWRNAHLLTRALVDEFDSRRVEGKRRHACKGTRFLNRHSQCDRYSWTHVHFENKWKRLRRQFQLFIPHVAATRIADEPTSGFNSSYIQTRPGMCRIQQMCPGGVSQYLFGIDWSNHICRSVWTEWSFHTWSSTYLNSSISLQFCAY